MRSEELFRERLEDVLKGYYPNSTCMDNLSGYLFTLVIKSLLDSEDIDRILEEYKGKSFSILEDRTFKKSLRDISVFVSQGIVEETLKETFNMFKNSIPLTKSHEYDTLKKPQKLGYSLNEMDFDEIDLESVPKVEKKVIPVSSSKESYIMESNEFEGDFEMDLEGINSFGKVDNTAHALSGDDVPDKELADKTPKVSISLDY